MTSPGVNDIFGKDMANCIKKLALEKAGLNSEAQSTASTIIQNLKNFGSAE